MSDDPTPTTAAGVAKTKGLALHPQVMLLQNSSWDPFHSLRPIKKKEAVNRLNILLPNLFLSTKNKHIFKTK